MKFIIFLSLVFLTSCARPSVSNSDSIQKQEVIQVKTENARYSLNALFLTSSDFSKPPLVILSGGTPPNPSDLPKAVPENMLGQAEEFLKLGFAVLIVERRGHGRSKEKFLEIEGDCEHRDQIKSGEAAASDILGALDYAQANLNIDATKIVLVGHSAGGFSSLFASRYQHRGIQAVINFAGGRGAAESGHICSKKALLNAYTYAGKTSRVPTLWIYGENDNIFSPKLAKELLKAFTSAGGRGELIVLPPFQHEGHNLFSSSAGVSIWLPPTKNFLKKLNPSMFFAAP